MKNAEPGAPFGEMMEANPVPTDRLRVIRPAVFFLASLAVVFTVTHSSQPIEPKPVEPRHTFPFNHHVHLSAGLDCTDCHHGVRTGTGAGVPDQDTCMTCHETPKGKSAAEAHLREMVAKGEPVRFHPRTELTTAGVFFSHRRHVKVAKIECQTCHGDMKQRTQPPEQSTVPLDMNFCLNCHIKQKANQDCLGCHH